MSDQQQDDDEIEIPDRALTVGIVPPGPPLDVDPYEDLTRKNKNQNIDLRKHFSWATYGLLVGWLLLVLSIVVLSGFKALGFELAENVLITLLVSSSANVIGMFFLVLKYLFDRNGD